MLHGIVALADANCFPPGDKDLRAEPQRLCALPGGGSGPVSSSFRPAPPPGSSSAPGAAQQGETLPSIPRLLSLSALRQILTPGPAFLPIALGGTPQIPRPSREPRSQGFGGEGEEGSWQDPGFFQRSPPQPGNLGPSTGSRERGQAGG